MVLYQEPLNEKLLRIAVAQMDKADTLIIGGTSLAVYPAAGLVDYFHGRNLVVINLGKISRSGSATLTISAPIGEVLKMAVLDRAQRKGSLKRKLKRRTTTRVYTEGLHRRRR